MAHKISDDCVSCGTCADLCPEGAVTEGKGKYEVNSVKCKDCGECEDTCRESAIRGDGKGAGAAT